MKNTNRMKPSPLATRAEYLETVAELATLETTKRRILAERDAAIQRVTLDFAARLAPITERIKGKFALAEAYAEEHRAELLPPDAKSVKTTLATFGWRKGNRKVVLMSRVSEEDAIAKLKALRLDGYVRLKEEVARDAILDACTDDKTLCRHVCDPVGNPVFRDGSIAVMEDVALSAAGLKIAQTDDFYIDPNSDEAKTLHATGAAAA